MGWESTALCGYVQHIPLPMSIKAAWEAMPGGQMGGQDDKDVFEKEKQMRDQEV